MSFDVHHEASTDEINISIRIELSNPHSVFDDDQGADQRPTEGSLDKKPLC
jgi:hypothetical protein